MERTNIISNWPRLLWRTEIEHIFTTHGELYSVTVYDQNNKREYWEVFKYKSNVQKWLSELYSIEGPNEKDN